MSQVVIIRLDVILAAAPARTFTTDYMSKLNAMDAQYAQRTEQWQRVSDARLRLVTHTAQVLVRLARHRVRRVHDRGGTSRRVQLWSCSVHNGEQ
jgi:hypothetical protein